MSATGTTPPAESHATRWHPMPNTAVLARVVAGRITEQAQAAIQERGVFKIVLAGGMTPQAVYRELAAVRTDWSCWRVYYGDERCLPADDPERNSVMATRSWLGRVPIPLAHIHPIEAELGAEVAAARYARVIAAARPFDLVLLGMGDDGHTASLFPGQPLDRLGNVHPVHAAPKPPPDRVSLGLEALNDSEEVLILVTGSSKRAAVRRWKAGDSLPVAGVHGHRGADVFIDATADG